VASRRIESQDVDEDGSNVGEDGSEGSKDGGERWWCKPGRM